MNDFNIDKISLTGLFNSKSIEWNLNKINVLVGKNGTGKSTLINIISGILNGTPNEYTNRCKDCTINFHGHKAISIENKENKSISLEELKIILDDVMKSKKGKFNKNELKKIISHLDNEENTEKVEFNTSTFAHANTTRDELKENVNIEFISTINMNSNSINEFKSSSGIKTTILDFEIQSEINRFVNKIPFKDNKEKLIQLLNNFYKESEKTVEFIDGKFIFNCENFRNIGFRDLSSGERQLFYILLRAANSSGKFTLFLMDEPEISLHLSWQEELINSILELNSDCQIIIVTHSPAIVMKGWMNSYIDMQEILKNE
ncbi:AAA family ATPase [Shewanella xiamenensis]|uniref:AAA family ATPase n=1 Tax=Shewanella xiamenensis TaxID=332186 RepID=UPI001F067D9A|nr:ATP-binding protein [Shewanella xiamenensis]UML93379.1 ATP-binding protein [Shewanella xiamenensis]